MNRAVLQDAATVYESRPARSPRRVTDAHACCPQSQVAAARYLSENPEVTGVGVEPKPWCLVQCLLATRPKHFYGLTVINILYIKGFAFRGHLFEQLHLAT